MKKKFTLFLVTLAMVLVPAFAAQAAFVTYTNYTAWLSAIGKPALQENFEDTTLLSGLSITEVGGAGSIHDGVYENYVNSPDRYQVYNYTSMQAFGAMLNLVDPGGPGTSIDMYINDTNTFVMNVPNSANGGFFGFISSESFTGVRLQEGNNGLSGIETYYNVDLHLVPTPEPLTMILLGLGLVGLAGVRRFK
jgi:PEP-CTERM motif